MNEVYLAKKSCGCIVALLPDSAPNVNTVLSEWDRLGYRVKRVPMDIAVAAPSGCSHERHARRALDLSLGEQR